MVNGNRSGHVPPDRFRASGPFASARVQMSAKGPLERLYRRVFRAGERAPYLAGDPGPGPARHHPIGHGERALELHDRRAGRGSGQEAAG